jgi:hypothetical protein
LTYSIILQQGSLRKKWFYAFEVNKFLKRDIPLRIPIKQYRRKVSWQCNQPI